jgi:ATP diphosphatase
VSDTPSILIESLLLVMRRLRDPVSGCPWDLQQTSESIAPFVIEEAYEVVDAIERNNMKDLRDELGDLLFQVVFHSQMAAEKGEFNFNDVVRSITEKMHRRHPHVFGNDVIVDVEAQSVAWDEHKGREREARGELDGSALAGVVRGLPEWQRALKLQKKAAAVGFDWPNAELVIEKIYEEAEEVRAELKTLKSIADNLAAHERLESEIGDLMFVCVNLARHAKVDVGTALRQANAKFERRFREMEVLAAQDGISFPSLKLEEQEAYWTRVKQNE